MPLSSSSAGGFTGVALLVLVLIAAVTDSRARRIPNWLTLGGMLSGLALNLALRGWSGLLLSGEGLALGFGVYLMFYLLRAMGAGDVKLMGAVGAIAGPALWFDVFLAASIASGVFALRLALAKGRLRETVWNIGYLMSELVHLRPPHYKHPELDVKHGRALKMPHGIAIAAGVIACLSMPALRNAFAHLRP